MAGSLPADPTPAAIILAGGEGSRLRALTRRLSGDDRPKQFCRLLGDGTLLEQTRRRLGRLVPADRVVFSVTRSHQPYWSQALADVPPEALVVQPEGRGTAPALLYALLRVQPQAGPGPVIILPSDHHVADDDAFMARVDGAVEACLAGPDLVVLIGIAPDRPETSYGWIEPGDLVLGPWPYPLYRVRRFWEKPEPAVARALERRGCLRNAFVIVARPAALLRLMAGAVPTLVQAFEPVRTRLGTPCEAQAARGVYGALPPADFSRDVLERCPGMLTVLPVSGVGWTDLGEPARVEETRQRIESAVPA